MNNIQKVRVYQTAAQSGLSSQQGSLLDARAGAKNESNSSHPRNSKDSFQEILKKQMAR